MRPLMILALLTAALLLVSCSREGSKDPTGTQPPGASDAGTDPGAAEDVPSVSDPGPADPGEGKNEGEAEQDVAPPADGAPADDDKGTAQDAGPWQRPGAGEPIPPEEITSFTREITDFWKDVDYFRWVRMHSHGLDPSNPQGHFDYALWWQDTQASKAGDTITFTHKGRADNLTLRTCKVLTNTIAGYLMFGGEDMRWLTEQYSKGLVALSRAMEFTEDDPVPYLQARAVFTHNHSYETVGGRKVAVDYDPIKRDEESWNAKIIHNPDNPHWGDMWLVNQRSKDDVPHMYRTVPMLMRAAEEAEHESVREAARLALEYLGGFAKDVVDSGYQIRTKFEDAEAVVPTKENGTVKDLASLVLFEGLVPNAECTAKLGSALIGYGETRDNECGGGSGGSFDLLAPARHYFNYAIIRYFHVAAVANARVAGYGDIADELVRGLAERADKILHDDSLPHYDRDIWWSDAAAFLLAAAAAGLPLTNEEARLVQEQYLLSADHYRKFERWDPWEETVEDGAFDYKPDRGVAVRPTELGYLLEYCASKLRHEDTAPLVDCDIVEDPSRWGTGE